MRNRVLRFLSGGRSRCAALCFGVLVLAGSAQAATLVNAGSITALGGSSIAGAVSPGPIQILYGASESDKTISIVLDLGSVQNVDIITIQNRIGANTNLAIRSLNIYVAPNEAIDGFDPLSLSSYTTLVAPNALLTPNVNTGSEMRPVDITDSIKRYFLINITNSQNTGASGFSTAADFNRVQIGNIYVTTIPEPSSIVLGGVALLGLAFVRHHRRRSSAAATR